ncbi:putative ribosome biogenesis GTPase RsgA [Candidatus Promineifilum breve]|uniref:Small ribosomal subunit biogenesis GTPase RsgA n=1 Tax=Candidatus Promineifilum breve TaxID=1806508 RepID=A0A160T121_9CHLR|nr:ribosome small subunit-dependent GTPase A [Candidatus Promineifilum breve]CUS03224.2 putative ribosome biogenesis GTPase RsgA [Candidatus Promineifilum breve]
MNEGLIIKAQSGFFTVQPDGGGEPVICQIRGRLKQERLRTAIAAVGDRVTYTVNADGSGLIQSVAERHSALSRTRTIAGNDRNLQTDREQVLVANPDQVVFVFSVRNPAFSPRKLDRFLVVAEMNHLPAVICANKVDLVDAGEARAMFRPYEAIGYPVIHTSTLTGEGIDALRETLRGRISVLAGSSGVGKSSLLNAVQADLGLRVKQVSDTTGKGLHTTRHVELIPLDVGGYVADTPGIRSLALFDLEPEELDAYFREIGPLVDQCAFSDCTHTHEPNCAVRAAVEDGRVSFERYDSYLRLREEQQGLQDKKY